MTFEEVDWRRRWTDETLLMDDGSECRFKNGLWGSGWENRVDGGNSVDTVHAISLVSLSKFAFSNCRLKNRLWGSWWKKEVNEETLLMDEGLKGIGLLDDSHVRTALPVFPYFPPSTSTYTSFAGHTSRAFPCAGHTSRDHLPCCTYLCTHPKVGCGF
jgi:hypothetical protein